MKNSFSPCWPAHPAIRLVGIPVFLVLSAISLTAQEPAPAPPDTKARKEAAEELRQTHRALVLRLKEFASRYAKDAPDVRQSASEVFHGETKGLSEELRKQGAALAQLTRLQEVPLISEVKIPDSASPAMEELLVLRAEMRNQRTRARNALRHATPAEAEQILQQEHVDGARLKAEFAAQSATVATEVALKPVALPPPPRLPAGASPELKEFILHRHAGFRQQIESINATRGFSSESEPVSRFPAEPEARSSSATK